MTTKLLQLAAPLPVTVVSHDLPTGMTPNPRRGACIGWWMTEESCLWLVVFDATGELVWVPMAEIRMPPNWSGGRRYKRHEVIQQ
jgi:hypothetical protein